MDLIIGALLGATVLYVYDLYVNGPAAARVFLAHLPALGWYIPQRDDWTILESYACVPISLFVIALLQYLMVQRDVALARAFSRR